MRDVISTLRRWQAEGARIGVATVSSTSRSAPRGAGATMALHENGEVIGSVSGGCVEGAVVEVATEVLATGQPQSVTYGISDDDAFAVGLTCGGTIEVFVRAVTPDVLDLQDLQARIDAEEPVAVATIVAHANDEALVGRSLVVHDDGVDGHLGDPQFERAVSEGAK